MDMNNSIQFGFFSEGGTGGVIPFVPDRSDFIAGIGQDTFILSFIPIAPATLSVFVLGILWQPSRYVISFNGLAWQVVLDTPQSGGEDVAVIQ